MSVFRLFSVNERRSLLANASFKEVIAIVFCRLIFTTTPLSDHYNVWKWFKRAEKVTSKRELIVTMEKGSLWFTRKWNRLFHESNEIARSGRWVCLPPIAAMLNSKQSEKCAIYDNVLLLLFTKCVTLSEVRDFRVSVQRQMRNGNEFSFIVTLKFRRRICFLFRES